VTNGHLDVLAQALGVADRVIVAVGVHPGKVPTFSAEERLDMIANAARDLNASDRISAITFGGLVVDAAREQGATLLIRGLRDGTDLDYEMQMAGTNATLAPEVHTVFLPASARVRHITATLVRQIAAMGGDVSAFVPPDVVERFKARYADRAAT